MIGEQLKRKRGVLSIFRRKESIMQHRGEKGFLKVENPEELYIDRLEPFPSAYTRHAYGVFLRGDGLFDSSHLLIKEFSLEKDAMCFLEKFRNSPDFERIKNKVFHKTSDRLYVNGKDFISAETYYKLYPPLKKYLKIQVEEAQSDWWMFLKKLGLKEDLPYPRCR